MAPLPQRQNVPGKLRLRERKVKGKSQGGNASCAPLLPAWAECLTRGVTLQVVLEVKSSNSYCENLAYPTKLQQFNTVV